MRTLSFLIFLFLFFAAEIPAQQDTVISSDLISQVSPQDTSDEIPQGVIKVRKANILPYVKVEYKYYLSHVSMVKVNVPSANGMGPDEVDEVPVFDSAVYSKRKPRMYPKKECQLLSKMFVENMACLYSVNDTPRVDTMVIGLWIDANGKVRRVLDDPEYTLKMPDQMVKELTRASHLLSGENWGQKGGYFQQNKRRFRQPTLTFESYYCEVFVIVSSYPLTQEQKITRYAPFDYPLNSPPTDEEQKRSMEKNSKVVPKK
jgi:hypothetical protein